MEMKCKEFAAIMHVTPAFVTQLIKGGSFPYTARRGKVNRLQEQAVCTWLHERRVTPDGLQTETFDKLNDENNSGADDWLTSEQARVLIGVSKPTLCRYRALGMIPFYRLGLKMIRYRRCELDDWGAGQ
jgi:predicted site-specific integrase-resolvase